MTAPSQRRRQDMRRRQDTQRRRQDMRRRRQAAERRGRVGELVAMVWLSAKGWRILARRWRKADGEVDLIARRGALVIFVEVKLRPSLDEAAHALTPWQWQRTARAARSWQMRHAPSCSWRYDAVLLAPWRWPVHLEGAWEEPTR